MRAGVGGPSPGLPLGPCTGVWLWLEDCGPPGLAARGSWVNAEPPDLERLSPARKGAWQGSGGPVGSVLCLGDGGAQRAGTVKGKGNGENLPGGTGPAEPAEPAEDASRVNRSAGTGASGPGPDLRWPSGAGGWARAGRGSGWASLAPAQPRGGGAPVGRRRSRVMDGPAGGELGVFREPGRFFARTEP